MNKQRFKFQNWIRYSAMISFAFTTLNCTPKQDENQAKIDQLIASMTLKQKAQLVIGTGMHFELPEGVVSPFGPQGPIDPEDSIYSNMVNHIRKFVPGAAGNSSMFEENGITAQVLADGPAGLRIQPKRKGEQRTYYCTAFPIATVLASTWDTELVQKVGQAMGNEVLEYGIDVLLAPGMNLQRDPLCGRNFEYYSEDPLVTGKMAAAMVNGIQSNGVGTSIKHFAANNQETNRMSVNTIVSQRALRELYLKGFEIAVKEAQPWTVMSSYNKINGQYASESNDLLTKVLRDDWGFKGYVMTDWGGGSDVVAQMVAGNDMIQPGSPKQYYDIIKAVEEGKLSVEVLNKNVSRILNIMLKTPKYKGYEFTSNPDLKAHAQVTRQAATDGMVLLENKDNALPLTNEVKNIAAFGTSSYEFIAGGTGSGDVNEAYTISLIEGITNGGLSVSAELTDVYQNYMKETRAKLGPPKNWLAALMGAKEPVPEMEVTPELAAEMAEKTDVALITIGRNSGEGGDRKPEAGDFYLTDNEKTMIENVSKAFQAKGKKAIVILNVGGVIETASWRNFPNAVLCAWQPGQEAGNSVVDVLTGKVNPSGKLAITWPMVYEDAPSAKTFPGHAIEGTTGNEADMSGFSFMRRVPWEVVYEEDIYVGYRYYKTFGVNVAYEFGYGLSYTNFSYSNLVLSTEKFKNDITVSIDVKNNGNVTGKEVVQVYVHAPSVKLKKPEATLVAFSKTKDLKPGESQTLSFTITTDEIASFNEATSSWIVEAGTYSLSVGASSEKIQGTKTFTVAKEIVNGTTSQALAPQVKINALSK